MRKCKCFFKRILMMMGVVLLLLIAVAFTSYPARVFAWFGPPGPRMPGEATTIVILGGGGIPSESGLMRCYTGAWVAGNVPEAEIIISLPTDGDPEQSSVARMRDELVMRGIAKDRIQLEYHATTTHAQATAVAAMLTQQGRINDHVLIVSSGYHLRRAVGCFRKAGVKQATGLTPTPTPDEYDLGPNVSLRYRFWNNAHMMVISAREACAILLYRLRGHL